MRMHVGSSEFCKVWWWAVQQLGRHRSKTGRHQASQAPSHSQPLSCGCSVFFIKEFDPGGEQSLFSDIYLSNKLHNSSSDQLIRFWRFGNSYSITEFADNNRLGRFRLNRRRYFDSTCELFPNQFYHAWILLHKKALI